MKHDDRIKRRKKGLEENAMQAQSQIKSKCCEALAIGAFLVILILFLPLIGVTMFLLRPLIAVAFAVLAGAGIYCLFEPRMRERLVPKVRSYRGIRMARGVSIDRGHCWAWTEPDVVVGADDLVQAVLGPIDHIRLPAKGQRVLRGEPLFSLEHADRSISLPSPVSGTVIGVNDALLDHPDLINRSPFTEGWVALIHADHLREERRELLSGSRARRWMQRQVDRMLRLLPSGDDATSPLYGRIDPSTWDELRTDICGGSRTPGKVS